MRNRGEPYKLCTRRGARPRLQALYEQALGTGAYRTRETGHGDSEGMDGAHTMAM